MTKSIPQIAEEAYCAKLEELLSRRGAIGINEKIEAQAAAIKAVLDAPIEIPSGGTATLRGSIFYGEIEDDARAIIAALEGKP